MDFFLLGLVAFLLVNIAVVVSMLRRVNLNNDSVVAWEQTQANLQSVVAVMPTPELTQYPALAEAA